MVFEYHKRKATRDFVSILINDFLTKFPGARKPGKNAIRDMWLKQMFLGTVNNCNSKASPGDTHSGIPRTQRVQPVISSVKQVIDRYAEKVMGDTIVSPVSSARRNVLAIPKSSWSRIKFELKYHPYKPIRRH